MLHTNISTLRGLWLNCMFNATDCDDEDCCQLVRMRVMFDKNLWYMKTMLLCQKRSRMTSWNLKCIGLTFNFFFPTLSGVIRNLKLSALEKAFLVIIELFGSSYVDILHVLCSAGNHNHGYYTAIYLLCFFFCCYLFIYLYLIVCCELQLKRTTCTSKITAYCPEVAYILFFSLRNSLFSKVVFPSFGLPFWMI